MPNLDEIFIRISPTWISLFPISSSANYFSYTNFASSCSNLFWGFLLRKTLDNHAIEKWLRKRNFWGEFLLRRIACGCNKFNSREIKFNWTLNAHVRLASTDNIFVLEWKEENNNKMFTPCRLVFSKIFYSWLSSLFLSRGRFPRNLLWVSEIFGAIGGLHDNREDSVYRLLGIQMMLRSRLLIVSSMCARRR